MASNALANIGRSISYQSKLSALQLTASVTVNVGYHSVHAPPRSLYQIRKNHLSGVNLQSFISVVHRQRWPLCHIVASDCVGEAAADPRADEPRGALASIDD